MPSDSPVTRAPDTAVSDCRVWGLDASVVCEPDRLGIAGTNVDGKLRRIKLACSRFRDDSEMCAVETAPGPSVVGPRLARLVSAALKAAEVTGGDVDPTVGAAMMRLGWGWTTSATGSVRRSGRVYDRPLRGRNRRRGSRIKLLRNIFRSWRGVGVPGTDDRRSGQVVQRRVTSGLEQRPARG
ncbi:FAD:protein FMN transferase [Prescottella soli]